MSIRRAARILVGLVILVSIVVACIFAVQLWKQQTRLAAQSQIRSQFETIASRCPPDVTRACWEALVSGVHNNLMQGIYTTYDELNALNRDLTIEMQKRPFQSEDDIRWLNERVGATSPSALKYTVKFGSFFEDNLKNVFHPFEAFKIRVGDLISEVREELSSVGAEQRRETPAQVSTNIRVLGNNLERVPSDIADREEFTKHVKSIVAKVGMIATLDAENTKAKKNGDEETVKANSDNISELVDAVKEDIESLLAAIGQ